jgi:hypothetical protein
MLDTWLVAIAGGAAGSVLTLLARYAAVPAEIRHHDRQVADIDRDLDRYTADEYVRLRTVLYEIKRPGGEPAQLAPELVAYKLALATTWSIHLYRDEETGRLRQYRDLAASEGWAHWVVRRLHPRLDAIAPLATPARAAVFVDDWRKLVPEPWGAKLLDPRQRTIGGVSTLLSDSLRAQDGTNG